MREFTITKNDKRLMIKETNNVITISSLRSGENLNAVFEKGKNLKT